MMNEIPFEVLFWGGMVVCGALILIVVFGTIAWLLRYLERRARDRQDDGRQE